MVFSTPKEALKMVFGVRSIRVFTQYFVGSLLLLYKQSSSALSVLLYFTLTDV